MKRIYTLVITSIITVGFSGCSLLKVSVSTGEPLTEKENNIRMMTRGFYHTFQSQVIQAADSIIEGTDDPTARIHAVRWKLKATRAITSAALKSVPELSAVETWVLCRNLDKTLKALPDSVLFGNQTTIARNTVSKLEKQYCCQLAEVMDKDRFALMNEFVELHSMAFTPDTPSYLSNSSSEWMEFLKGKGKDYKCVVGSVSEVIADTGDKMERYADQVSKDLSYGKEIWEYRLEEGSIYGKLNYRLDEMEHNFDQMVSIMERLPEISNCMLDSLGQQAQEIMELMTLIVDETFNNVNYQRKEMQQYISEERKSILEEMRGMADDSLRTLMDALPGLIGQITGWIILLVVVVFGVPFMTGFWLGKLHEKQHIKKKEKKDK